MLHEDKKVGIKSLPQVSEIQDGDYILVEKEDGTSILDFKDFVIGDANTTTSIQISSLQTDVESISGQIKQYSAFELINSNTAGDGLQHLPTATWTSLTGSTLKFDVGGDVVKGTGVYTAPLSGIYLFTGTAKISSLTTSESFHMMISKNDVDDVHRQTMNVNGEASVDNDLASSLSHTIFLRPTATIRIKAYTSASTNRAIREFTFSGHLVQKWDYSVTEE